MIAATIVGKLNLRRSQVCRTRNLHRRKTFSSFPSPCLPRKKHFREIPRMFFAFIFKFLRRRKSAQTYDTRHNHSDLCDHSFPLNCGFRRHEQFRYQISRNKIPSSSSYPDDGAINETLRDWNLIEGSRSRLMTKCST